MMHPEDVSYQSLVLARIDPTEEKVNVAIADAKAHIGQSRRGLDLYAATLAQFGRVDKFYRTMGEMRRPTDKIDTGILFWSLFRKVRRDVRFIKLAKDIGLLNYWRTSGKWPDFCFDPDHPYDCKKEAAKLSDIAP